ERGVMRIYIRMIGYLRPYTLRVAQVVVLSLLVAGLQIGSLGAMKPLFDTLFAGEEADFKLALVVTDSQGRLVDGIRIRPKMPDGWKSKFGREGRVLEHDVLTLEGRREMAGYDIPLMLTNRTGRTIEGLNVRAETIGRGWEGRIEVPPGLRVEDGAKTKLTLRLEPDRREPLFRAPIWKTSLGKIAAEWIQTNVFANKFHALLIISAFILGATFLKSGFGYSKGYWTNFLARRTLMDIRRELFDSIISQSIAYFDRRKSGHIISRFTNSLNQMNKGMTSLLQDVVLEPMILVGSLILAFSINPGLATIGILIFPLNYLLIMVTGRWIRRSTDRSLRERANMVTLLQKSIEGIRIVKAFVMEDHERERFESANAEAFRYDMRGARAKSLVQPVVEIFSAAFIVVFLLLGGMAVLQGDMSPGDFVVFYAAMVACYSPIKKLNNAVGEIQESVAGAVDVFLEIDHVPDLREAGDAVEIPVLAERIEFKGVSFAYDPSNPVLRSVDLTIRKGEFIAVVGPSGAGKSTLVNLLPRFYDVVDGRVEIDGLDIRKAKLDSLRRQMGFVTQEPILFHDTILSNISFGNREGSVEDVERAARTAHAHEFVTHLPEQYQTIVGDRGVMLSGGQRQRIAMARAVMRDPAVLILDEATSSLDSESERLIQEAMETFVKGRTTIVIAHRLSTVLKADRIIVMEQGRIAQQGTHDELIAAGGLYRRLYEVQFRDMPDLNGGLGGAAGGGAAAMKAA
ncbi:MAG TPA: ABC transporter ATP-binding protein, partial [Verrucomicrobiae bacterium]|nr:ABC transporter ATP-binding protein [Verrucomicrobiae bacterium]